MEIKFLNGLKLFKKLKKKNRLNGRQMPLNPLELGVAKWHQ